MFGFHLFDRVYKNKHRGEPQFLKIKLIKQSDFYDRNLSINIIRISEHVEFPRKSPPGTSKLFSV